jgi:hypothetical protein
VLLKSVLEEEAFAAQIALVRPLARVLHLVPAQRLFRLVGPGAKTASVQGPIPNRG